MFEYIIIRREGAAFPPRPEGGGLHAAILMTVLVVLTVLEIVVLIAALAFYLFWVGTLLARIAGNLEECAEIVRGIVADAALIGPGVEHINETGGVVAGALPLLYGMAEDIVADVTPQPERPPVPEPARPASGTRRSRLLDAVGFAPRLSRTDGGASPGANDPSARRDVSARAARPPIVQGSSRQEGDLP